MKKEFYRQGDVGVLKVAEIPKDAVKMARKGNKTILAYGEKTGHHHRFETRGAVLYKSDNDTFLEVTETSDLLHEEHTAITFEPGVYKIIGQREYSPEEIRRVTD